ncbi:DNA polymerase III subunit delta' [Alphaproteobacteria bacterium KMM 3653]|uniref:DNA polymerase III subunit delta n=1 Tax=Harenicola maris TaxID=2841044 RepID=A0AAP2CSJ6_9RHOB|nr:DNA polymerase III subunit delta' [Harenicola maris]
MSTPDDIPQSDQLEGAPHPRDTLHLYGQEQAEAQFLEAAGTGRLHHAWLITGPRGVGKATLAWRIARHLLTTPVDDGGMFGAPPPPTTLDVDPNHPVIARMAALSEPGLFVLRRPWDDKAGKLKTEITVNEARKLKGFFSLSVTDGGRRVVIIDSADEMNPSAANAVLKLLEEPPEKTTLLLVCHRPARILPTIKSRCRTLKCAPLAPDNLRPALMAAGLEEDAISQTLLTLSGGSVGAGVTLAQQDGPALYTSLVKLLATLPRMDRSMAGQIAERAAARNDPNRFRLTVDMLDLILARMARHGILGPQEEATQSEADIFNRLSPDPRAARIWADLQSDLGTRARTGAAVNLDPAALILDMLLRIEPKAHALAPSN